MSRKFQKSSSTHTLFKSKISGSVGAPSSLKATQTKFKFHEPFFSSLHGQINEENQYLSETQKWKEKKALNPPKRRSFHTSCIYDNYIYIFGGKDITEGKLCDIMRLNLLEEDNPSWESVIPNNDIQLEPLAYHTGNLVDNKYYIIGGSNVFLRQSPNIYIYDLKRNYLEKIRMEKTDDLICYLSMHTANYYPERNEIILFGGYSDGNMLNQIFRFNLRTYEIKAQKVQNEDNIPEPRIGHAAFIHKNFLYIFGGSLQDGNLLNDFWKLDLNNFIWEKLLENNQNIENYLIVPSPRSGHSLFHLEENKFVYIFGGKIGNFQESNDLWQYDIENNKFNLIHDTILEQYSSEELEEFLKEKNSKKKNKENDFHFISKKEIEDKLNPYSKLYTENKNINNKIIFKSKSTKEFNKSDYENEIFINPGYYQMKHSSIYNLDNKDVNNAIAVLDMLLPYKIGEKGIKMPLPRDGASLLYLDYKLIVFGGDRNKYPFNDLYFYDLK